jgi:hypothetical protein
MNTNFDALVAEVELAKVEAEKFYGEKGNAQAGKRLREHLKNIANFAKIGRKDVSETKASRRASKATA